MCSLLLFRVDWSSACGFISCCSVFFLFITVVVVVAIRNKFICCNKFQLHIVLIFIVRFGICLALCLLLFVFFVPLVYFVRFAGSRF